MAVIESRVIVGGDDFQQNREDMRAFVDKLRAIECLAVEASNRRAPVFEKRGQIPPYQRV